MIDMSKQVGPFVGVSFDATRTFSNGRSFRFVVYGAYNAFGLIGSEKNGVAILDNDALTVVVDELEQGASGYYGPSAEQKALFDRVTSESFAYEDLCALVNVSDRARLQLESA